MDFEKELSREHSKSNTLRIAKFIDGDKEKFAEFIRFFLDSEGVLSKRAAWVFSHVGLVYPERVKDHYGTVLRTLLREGMHNAVYRNILKVFSEWEEFPEKDLGLLVDRCFDFVSSPDQPVTIKCYSMEIIARIANEEPVLLRELKSIIDSQWENASPGLKARSRKIFRGRKIR